MKKFTLSLCLLTAFSLLVLPLATFAAYNDYTTDADTTIYMETLGINLTIDSGAELAKLEVTADNFTITSASGSNMTIRSSDRKDFAISSSIPDSDWTFSCGSSESVLTITSSASYTGTITPMAATCSNTTMGGGGGGGGAAAPTVVTPSNVSVSINAGAAQTRNRTVTLTLGATNASMMMISESSVFTGAGWVNYATSQSFTFSNGVGTNTVYVKYKSSTGGISSVVSDSITLAEALTAKVTQNVSASTGGSVALSDNSASVTIPGSAVAGDVEVVIEPTESYTAPETGKGIVGGQAFNFSASVGGASIETFEKNVTLSFNYTDSQIKGIKESTLKVYYWNETLSKWVLAGGVVNSLTNTISVDIDHFTLFAIMGEKEFGSGDLVKLECDGTNESICTAVYYLGNDGKRYVFPNSKIFFTWYDDFSSVKIIGADDLASYLIGGNVTYRPGVRMVKITSDPKVYAVGKNGVLRWVQSESVASALYGSTWNQSIDDLVDSFFFSYVIGDDVTMAADFDKDAVKAASPDINTDKEL